MLYYVDFYASYLCGFLLCEVRKCFCYEGACLWEPGWGRGWVVVTNFFNFFGCSGRNPNVTGGTPGGRNFVIFFRALFEGF